MAVDPSIPVVLALGGLVGVVATGLALFAFWEFKDSHFRRLLLPVVVTTMLFTFAHALLFFWPAHPPIVNVLEPLSYTVLAIGVIRLITLHPGIFVVSRGERK
jgi:hypothetical protein